jgi:pilus assembly protein CpaB
LVTSTVLGAGALLVARVWIPGHTASAAVPARQAFATVPVVTAAIPIPYGAKLEGKYLVVSQMPVNIAPPSAFHSIQQILLQPGGAPLALTPMSTLEPVLPSKLSGPGGRFSMAQVIGPGMRAYTIGVNEISGDGGHVVPGDRVDVVLTRDLSGAPSANLDGQRMVSTVVVENLRVLGMDLNANPTANQPVVPRTATLEVTTQDSLRLALAMRAGQLSLALRRIGADQSEPVRPVLVSDLGASNAPAASRTAVRSGHPRAVHPAHAPEAPGGAGTITVVLGEARSNVAVPAEHNSLGAL